MERRDFLKSAGAGALAAGAGLVGNSVPVRAVEARGNVSLRDGRLVTTTRTDAWRAGTQPAVLKGADFLDADIIIMPHILAQTIEGFGACFNELGWDAIKLLPAGDREAIFQEMFGAEGAAFSLCRLPIGANDFARDWYSYDETPGDFALRNFKVDRDETSLIPFIKAAQSVRPDLKLWSSPWSPPTWMKRNGHYALSPNLPKRPPNGLRPEQVGREGTDMFILDDRHLDAYARYFGRYVDEYRKRGIAIGMVMPQNEFNSAQPFPSCTWTPDGLAKFLPFLGKEMDKRGVEVFFGTLERTNDKLFERVIADPAAAKVIKGIGVQWDGKVAIPFIHHDHPDLRVYQTEQECGDGKNDWRYARYAWSLFKTYMSNGANAHIYWNIALPEGGVSTWGWEQNSLLTVDRKTKSFRWNHEYWLMKHISAAVRPGARFIKTMSYKGYEDILAFKNPDGSIALVMHNPLGEPMAVKVMVGSKMLGIILPPDSFSSLIVEQGGAAKNS